jgi:CheY-like chemotaxis protein
MQKSSGAPVILLIENDENDVFLFRRALYATGWRGDLRVVGSATEARLYMENGYPYEDPLYFGHPQLIVSDYRLAGHTAIEFVVWVRSQPEFVDLPIVILSGVAGGYDVAKSAAIKPTAFISKTGDVQKLAELVKPVLPESLPLQGRS